MKQFWKDYGELCKDAGRFYKKHWKGCAVLNLVIIGAEFAYHQYRYNLIGPGLRKEIQERGRGSVMGFFLFIFDSRNLQALL